MHGRTEMLCQGLFFNWDCVGLFRFVVFMVTAPFMGD
jgi:hypothetical protein